MTKEVEDAVNAAEQASEYGWLLMFEFGVMFAVNPDNSSEVWTFYHAEDLWKRHGDTDCCNLRRLN